MATLARILCAIDLEKASERAFDRALNLAIISEAKLHLLHATPADVPFSWRATERLHYLTGLRERAEAAGVKVRVEEQHGDPARVIGFTQTPGKWTSWFWARIGAGVGDGSERGPCPNVYSGARHGRCSSFPGRSSSRLAQQENVTDCFKELEAIAMPIDRYDTLVRQQVNVRSCSPRRS